jgi:hypothetical protein
VKQFSRPEAEAVKSDCKNFWLESNAPIDVSDSVLKNLKAFAEDSVIIDRAIFTLVHQIDMELNSAQTLSMKQQDVVRQMSENAALLMAAAANRKATKQLSSNCGQSVSTLLQIASDHGANHQNIQQLQKLADEIMSI